MSIELLTWTIPPHLDPTFHIPHAKRFEELRQLFYLFNNSTGCAQRGDLIWFKRGWVACLDTNYPSKEEPSVKTHVFVLFWKSREDELRFKDPAGKTFIWGCDMSWNTCEREGNFWEKVFVGWQKEWEELGMRSQSLHLRVHRALKEAN